MLSQRMIHRSTLLLFLAVTGAALAALACRTHRSTETTESSPPPKLDHLRVGYLPVTGHGKFFVARDERIFEKEGLDVELVEFANSADGLSALRAGQIDVGAFGTTAPLVHIAKGADLRIIGGIMGEDASVIATEENAPSIRTVADLKGKKVATVRLATGDAVIRGALARQGIDWQKDLEIFELKSPPAVIEAVKNGQVQAGVVWGPHDLRAKEQGLKVVLLSSDLSPGHPCCRIAINGKDLEPKRNAWQRFLRAILEAERFAQTNHEATVNHIVAQLKLDRTLVEHAFYHGHLDQSSDPNLKGIQEFWQTMKASKFVEPNDKDISAYVDSTLFRAAVSSLQKQEPAEPFWKHAQEVAANRN